MSDDENDDEDSEDEGSSGMSKGEAGQPQCLAGKASEAATVAAQQVCAWCSSHHRDLHRVAHCIGT